MLKNITFGKKIGIGYGLILGLMLIVSTVTYNGIKSLIQSTGWVDHTHKVIAVANQLSGSMVDMETGLRGFMVTGDKNYLDPYFSGNKLFDKLIKVGPELTSDNPTQVSRWKEVEQLKKEWINKWSEIEISKRKEIAKGTKSISRFKDISSRPLGKELFDGIRAKLSNLDKLVSTNDLKSKHLLTKTTLALVNMETGQRGFLLSGKEESLEPYVNGKKDLVKYLNQMKVSTTGISKNINAVEKAVNLWQNKVANVEIAARQDMNRYTVTLDDLILDMSKGIGKKYMDTIRAKIQVIVQAEEKMIVVRSLDQKDTADFAIIFTIIGTLISIILGLAVAWLISKNITTSLANFQKGLLGFFKYLNREESNVQLLDDSSSDELGIMSKVVNQNIEKTKEGIEEDRKVIEDTIKVLSEFEQGDLCQRVHSSTNNPALQELTKLLNQMGGNIETNINSVLDVLEEYSNSKYINKVKTSGIKDHLLSLANGVNTLGDAITTMLVENKSNGLTLGDSSAILLKNVNTLNQNSNESAAALEETSAALEEVTSNISSTTNNIVDMATLAESVTKSANHGENLAEQTNIAMNEIDKEVNSINEAISVIDQIAFQTNILSLNAAVEAATAGEAGKGFAVVAQEVRNLASRSAEAANEIKELVQKATQKADSGKAIANSMIDGYHGLNQNISKTIELIGNVETASKEQLDGIKQINDAITSLDQQTQENAVVASHTNDIASQTDSIANLIVSNADEKEFVGKDSVKAKSLENTKTQASKQKSIVTQDIKSKAVDKKALKSTKEITSISSKKDDDEWASF